MCSFCQETFDLRKILGGSLARRTSSSRRPPASKLKKGKGVLEGGSSKFVEEKEKVVDSDNFRRRATS